MEDHDPCDHIDIRVGIHICVRNHICAYIRIFRIVCNHDHNLHNLDQPHCPH